MRFYGGREAKERQGELFPFCLGYLLLGLIFAICFSSCHRICASYFMALIICFSAACHASSWGGFQLFPTEISFLGQVPKEKKHGRLHEIQEKSKRRSIKLQPKIHTKGPPPQLFNTHKRIRLKKLILTCTSLKKKKKKKKNSIFLPKKEKDSKPNPAAPQTTCLITSQGVYFPSHQQKLLPVVSTHRQHLRRRLGSARGRGAQ